MSQAATSLQASGGVRQLCQVVVDANASGDQVLMTATTKTYVTDVIIERTSGSALTIAVIKVGFGASANDVVASQALSGLGAIGLAIDVLPIAGFAPGAAAQTLKANMSTLAGGAATITITVMGVGG